MTATDSRSWRFLFTSLLVAGMATATLLPTGIGVAAPFIRDDLGLSRTQIGALISGVIALSAVASPRVGTLTDRFGGRHSLGLVFFSGFVAFVGFVVAPSYLWMFIPIVAASISQAFGNPATNKLIALHAAPGRRGVVTGIKQSGVQAGVFVGGLIVPVIAEAFGWRWAMLALGLVPLIGLLITYPVLPPDGAEADAPRSTVRGHLSIAVVYLAVYGGLMGFAASYTFLIPLFAEESLGFTEQAAGLAAGLIGLISLFARIAWARFADRRGIHAVVLSILAFLAVAAVAVIWSSQSSSWLLWIGVVLTGLSSSSWNSVGMLAVIGHAGPERAGGASGIVMLGFLTGLGIGPALFGWLVDETGSYTIMWVISLAVFAATALLSLWWVRTPRRPAL